MATDIRSLKEHLSNRNFLNRKPYRTASQKAEARRTAKLVDGRWVSSAPVTFHKGGAA